MHFFSPEYAVPHGTILLVILRSDNEDRDLLLLPYQSFCVDSPAHMLSYHGAVSKGADKIIHPQNISG